MRTRAPSYRYQPASHFMRSQKSYPNLMFCKCAHKPRISALALRSLKPLLLSSVPLEQRNERVDKRLPAVVCTQLTAE